MNCFWVLLLGCSWGIGQHTEIELEPIFRAEQIYRSKQNLETAIPLYREAIQDKCIDLSKALDAVNCATKVGDTLSMVEFIEYGMLLGMETQDYSKLWEYIGNGQDLDDLLSNCDTITNKNIYQSQLNEALIDSLKVFAERDQKYRSADDDKWELQREEDRLNWEELKAITLRMGRLPRYTEIGKDGSEDMDILFYHMDKEILEWFLPYVLSNIENKESTLGEVILYHLDRMGMAEGVIYWVVEGNIIAEYGKRKKMKNGFYCQAYGEWFEEKSMEDGKIYFVPLDPSLDRDDVNTMRALFHLDPIESKWKRKPWVNVVSIQEFEQRIKTY